MLRKGVFLLLMVIVMGSVLSGCGTESDEAAVAKNKILNFEEFGEEVLGILKEDGPEFEYEWKDVVNISVYQDGEERLVMNLENAYNEYSVQGLELYSVIDNLTNGAFALLRDDDSQSSLSEEHIMATIKAQDYIEYVRGQGIEPVCDELVEGLYILYMLDTPEMARPFTEEELVEAGIARDEVRDLAVKNLTETLLPILEINEVDGVYLTAADGMYESALILCDIWDMYPIENDYVIGIPERSFLIIADSKNTEAIDNMDAAGKNLYNEASYPITDKLLYWSGSEFTYLNSDPS